MRLNKNYFALSGLALLATIFVACGDDDPSEVYVGEMPKYQKAYITTGVSYPNGTEFKGSFSGKVEFTEEGKVIYSVAESMNISGNGSFDANLYFRTNYAVKKAISGTVAVVPDAEAFVAQYNSEHQSECKLLPAEYYTIENGHATIEAGSKSASIHVAVNTERSWEQGEYLLPLSLTLDSGSEIALAEDQNTICLKYVITKDSYRILSRDDFEIDTANSTAGCENAVDSDRSTVWRSSGKEGYLYVVLKEPQYVSRIYLVDCNYAYFVWMSYAETPDDLFGGNYDWGTSPGLVAYNASQTGYDESRKAKRVTICNYSGNIADIYFLVHD